MARKPETDGENRKLNNLGRVQGPLNGYGEGIAESFGDYIGNGDGGIRYGNTMKLSTLTVDNCTTNDAIINILLDKLPMSSLMMCGSLRWIGCSWDGIERIRDSVAFWTASPKRDQKFEKAARQLGISSTKKLALDCKTRWNSTYLMISVAIVYKDVFQRLHQQEPQYKNLPTQRDWEFAKEICDRLQLFYEVTVMFSSSKYPTTNEFFPSICEIRYSLVDWSCSPSEVIRHMAKKMLLKFDKYWSVIHGIMGMAVVLDHRYKLKFVELLFPVLYGQDKSAIELEKLKELVYTLFQEYEFSNPGVRNNNEGVSGSSFLSSGSSASHQIEFKKLLSNIASIANQHDDSGTTTELDNYLKDKLLPKDMELDLLLWWKTNGFKYPTLQRMARDILAVPILTVASESAFSTGGRLVTPHRSRLLPKTLEALMCAQKTCSDETEAYCRTIEYDYDVEEEAKGSESLG
ncbi:zinc finger BED domain-containing protein RICESLEEPER 2-like [Cynara cardunculus var. scolymus]|uniref:zinc finger BED domain-containing protein RICESLEEPER 2-like n=1 Tax=Cynara cardunculus var. scolymus TaxID=59895 RepID=UPI000D62EFA5|nr:zinc finger BED domain-containing protein RICESLEEPER 2-like [Cynara cardunculus var. scolymus]